METRDWVIVILFIVGFGAFIMGFTLFGGILLVVVLFYLVCSELRKGNLQNMG